MDQTFTIRKAGISDIDEIRQLFYDTITSINTRDYNEVQIDAWSSGYHNVNIWKEKLETQTFFVAESEKGIVGFGSITNEGYLDYLYTHKHHQRQGIATMLELASEQWARSSGLHEIHADVSLTARPFFLSMGFIVSKIYSKEFQGITFTNTIMTKTL